MQIPIDRFEAWLENKNLKEKTIKEYLYYFTKFIRYGTLTNESMSRFISDKSNRNVVARSFILNYKKFLLQNYREFEIPIETVQEIQEVELPTMSGRSQVRLTNPLTKDQVYLLEKYLSEEKDKLMLLLCFHCGLRFGELIKIKVISFNWNDWKQDTSKMGECKVYGKGDKQGIALVPLEIMIRVARYIKSHPNLKSVDSYLFIPNPSTGSLLFKGRLFRNKLKKAGIDSGITQRNEKGGLIKETVVYPHRLRHSYGTYLLNEKHLDIREVQEALRHSSISSTEIYTHINKEKLKERIGGI